MTSRSEWRVALEDDALTRLLDRLDLALWQVKYDDPDIEWRNTHATGQ
jgi:hypothetical protein